MVKRAVNKGYSVGKNKAGTCDVCYTNNGFAAMYNSGMKRCYKCHLEMKTKEEFICFSIENNGCRKPLFAHYRDFQNQPTNSGVEQCNSKLKTFSKGKTRMTYKLESIQLSDTVSQGYKCYVISYE